MQRAIPRQRVRVIYLFLVALGALVFCSGQGPTGVSAAEFADLEVRIDSGGGVRATAHVLFPAKTEIIQAVLTDYAHWPDLFEVRMRLVDVTVESEIATVDLRIDHALMPGERQLLTETRVLPGGRLVTDLKGGDFRRYHRVYMLHPSHEGTRTLAEFELVIEPELMIPDWLLVMVTRQELEAHFRLVTHKAEERTRLSFHGGQS